MEETAKESTGCQNETKTDKYKLRNLGKMWMEYDGQLEKKNGKLSSKCNAGFNVVKQLEMSDIWGILHKHVML